ncbi:MAG: dTDP-4-dehydrorhamnose 3,5-epimerase [Planctomycetaceae bacterium]|nr:dTDP-4-dehydrorhamnose 3,5-epimerase [Planctomycetaceae bacterium]
MNYVPTPINGAWIVEPERRTDERGWFARSWCVREFEEHGLNPRLVQCNISFNNKSGTLRGMHFQRAPHGEAKLVRVTKGAIHDVILDLRKDSPSYLKWFGVDLTGDNHRMLYIPEGVAHGFQTLTEESEVFYQMSEFYYGDLQTGVRWDDPAFDIRWPHCESRIIAAKDSAWPDYAR